MAAIACVNSGAGLVTVATDRDNITALHAHLPEAMAFDLRETERFLDNLRAADVVLIGSGLGEDGAASQAMDLVLANIKADQNLVVDGSALNLLAKKTKKDLPDCHLSSGKSQAQKQVCHKKMPRNTSKKGMPLMTV